MTSGGTLLGQCSSDWKRRMAVGMWHPVRASASGSPNVLKCASWQHDTINQARPQHSQLQLVALMSRRAFETSASSEQEKT